MLDFSKLRSEVSGYRGAFEGLICQIGRRHPPTDAEQFVTIDGSGGDGGLEAYWIKSSGNEVGYQAKFHTRSGDIDWPKIDRSVEAALQSHPKMTLMVIAVACDLTDNVPNRRGKSAREKWQGHREKWIAAADALGRVVEFDLWDASKIEDLLVEPVSAGLREYWFGEVELTRNWFRRSFERTEAALEERYNPEDHVDVSTEAIFGGLLRDQRFQSKLTLLKAAIKEACPRHRIELHKDVSQALSELSGLVTKVASCHAPHWADPSTPFFVDEILDRLKQAQKSASGLMDLIEEHRSKAADAERGAYNVANSRIWQLQEACENLKALLEGKSIEADHCRFALIEGPAGSGKSHLLASEADKLTAARIPVIMMLGTDFSDAQPISEQLSTVLGLPCGFEKLLDTLNSAAEAVGSRAVIAIDAINEGAGQRWRTELKALAKAIVRRPWLTFVVSCRTEYAPYLITEGVRKLAVEAQVEGFTTEEEQERAAEIYLDNRGIVRPATPWLSPEFSNPLFLRTTAISLEADGRHEYPSGLHGTKEVFAFFLRVVGRHMVTNSDGSTELFGPLARAVKALATYMARNRQDHVPLDQAFQIADDAFSNCAQQDRRWLDLLRLRGIIRFDPFLKVEPMDPLDAPDHVVRFAFQRFQDHLVAEALLDRVCPSPEAFLDKSALGFMLHRYEFDGHHEIRYDWRGVFQALWIGHAERNDRELLDDLPTDELKIGLRSDIFVETVYWRSPNAFTARTLELLNQWVVRYDEYGDYKHIRVLLRLCTRDHPWNAEFLHARLNRWKLPERDEYWTVPINSQGQYGDEQGEAARLVRWCHGPAIQRATDEVLERALTVLGWLFTTTNRGLRDRATKAAVSILIERPQLLPAFINRFAAVDDPYVLERVIASCAGACLRDPINERLKSAAHAVFEALFSTGAPPQHLLTRDYGRLIVELAFDRGVLPEEVNLEYCRPPYASRLPKFPKNFTRIEERAKAVGADSILNSCTGWIGDFGENVIKRRIREFSTRRLISPAPETPTGSRWEAKRSLEIDAERAKFWVANRAISLGWTKERFPKDATHGDDRVHVGKIERIGKKYQWIAFFELLARMADNYWMVDEYHSHFARQYDTPVDTPFVRDVEITLPAFEEDTIYLNSSEGFDRLPIKEVPVERQLEWVFENGTAQSSLQRALDVPAQMEGKWLSLYRYSSSSLEWPEGEGSGMHSVRQDEFHFQMLIGVPKQEAASFIKSAERSKMDFHDWLPESRTDAGYLYELGQRKTWDDGRVGPDRGSIGKNFSFRQFTVGYHWEHHLDRTVSLGLEMQVPSPWLVQVLALRADPNVPGRYIDDKGLTKILAVRGPGSMCCIAHSSGIEALLAVEGLVPVIVGIGERTAWPKNGNGEVARIRWNAMIRFSGSKPNFTTWSEKTNHITGGV